MKAKSSKIESYFACLMESCFDSFNDTTLHILINSKIQWTNIFCGQHSFRVKVQTIHVLKTYQHVSFNRGRCEFLKLIISIDSMYQRDIIDSYFYSFYLFFQHRNLNYSDSDQSPTAILHIKQENHYSALLNLAFLILTPSAIIIGKI